jgi:hypothetical protein
MHPSGLNIYASQSCTENARTCRILCVSMASDRQGLDRDELHVDLGCLRKCAQVAGI